MTMSTAGDDSTKTHNNSNTSNSQHHHYQAKQHKSRKKNAVMISLMPKAHVLPWSGEMNTCICSTHTYGYMYIYIYIYLYMVTPPMNYRTSFCIVNTVSKQLFRQVRILYLSKTTENKLRFQENVSVNSFTFDVRSGSCIS